MYKCKVHGTLENEFCDCCGEIIDCDCSDIALTKLKDLVYNCDDGSRTVTVCLEYCRTCGKVFKIR